MSAPSKDGFSEMLKVVCSMLSRNECMVFREPVDWKGLGLADYPEIVQRPMDLGTIKKKIENDDYATVEDIATDIRLVWTNCMLYNRDGSEVSCFSLMDRKIHQLQKDCIALH
jgi:Bromodomain